MVDLSHFRFIPQVDGPYDGYPDHPLDVSSAHGQEVAEGSDGSDAMDDAEDDADTIPAEHEDHSYASSPIPDHEPISFISAITGEVFAMSTGLAYDSDSDMDLYNPYGVCGHESDHSFEHSPRATVSPSSPSHLYAASVHYISFESQSLSFLPSAASGVSTFSAVWTMNVVPSFLIDITHTHFRSSSWLRAECAAIRRVNYEMNENRPAVVNVTEDFLRLSNSHPDHLHVHRQVYVQRCKASTTNLHPCGIMGSATHGTLEACRAYRITLAADTIDPRPIIITPELIHFLRARLCVGPDLSTHLVCHASGDRIAISQLRYAQELITHSASVCYSVTSALGRDDNGTALFDYYLYTPKRVIGVNANNH